MQIVLLQLNTIKPRLSGPRAPELVISSHSQDYSLNCALLSPITITYNSRTSIIRTIRLSGLFVSGPNFFVTIN